MIWNKWQWLDAYLLFYRLRTSLNFSLTTVGFLSKLMCILKENVSKLNKKMLSNSAFSICSHYTKQQAQAFNSAINQIHGIFDM